MKAQKGSVFSSPRQLASLEREGSHRTGVLSLAAGMGQGVEMVTAEAPAERPHVAVFAPAWEVTPLLCPPNILLKACPIFVNLVFQKSCECNV